MTRQLDWSHATADVPQHGLLVERRASEEERALLAAALEILACARLDVRYEIEPRPQGRYLASGQLTADFVQSCVVTLEPVGTRVEDSFEIAFWPAEQVAPSPYCEHEQDVLTSDDPEPIENHRLAIGRVVFELIAAGLDPYPRKADARFAGAESSAGAHGSERDGPFAALAEWKPKSE